MNRGSKQKKEPWRIAIFILSVLFIIGMWVKKDIAGIYATMPAEQAAPLIATTAVVSLVKVAAIAGGMLLIKWLAAKIKK